nr:desumoylating isopeptidase 1 [Quercus suber]
MNVELYVYDLTGGMARTMSRQLLGIQIDAVYHTSLVLNGREIFFGAGIQECRPGTTHHGAPIERIAMGATHLPLETIDEYLESLKEVYSAASYDLFEHNCNNFTNDFGMFLVGKGVPEHITGLPRRVLDTPFGAMLRPQIDASMRSVTQAPVAPQPSAARAATAARSNKGNTAVNPTRPFGKVIGVTSLSILEKQLKTAVETASTVFFTSSTCPPCRLAYPTFDSLAEEHPEALFVKVDIDAAQDAASHYQIRATPTFLTFAKGSKQDEWSGADPALLRANVERVLRTTFPPHPHAHLNLPSLQYGSIKPITYNKTPPLDKLMAKLGQAAQEEAFISLERFLSKRFLSKRNVNPQDAALPDLGAIGEAYQSRVLQLPVEVRFTAIDLFRCALADPRVSGFYAEETQPSTILALINHVNALPDCPHNLRLVSLHLACNIFSSPLSIKELLAAPNELTGSLTQLIASSLLDTSHSTTRVAASTLAFNLAVCNYRRRREDAASVDALPESEQVELAASLLETLASEESGEARKTQLLALGYLVYFAPRDGELVDLCQAMDAQGTVQGLPGHDKLASEVGSLF